MTARDAFDKPFALMAADIDIVRSICQLSKEKKHLLTSREKPIVLLTKRNDITSVPIVFLNWVAPNLDNIGVMLPYTPLHHLLLNQTDPLLHVRTVPPILVMTSGNFSEEPIATDNEDALQRLSPLADAFLLHNREIHIRSDVG